MLRKSHKTKKQIQIEINLNESKQKNIDILEMMGTTVNNKPEPVIEPQNVKLNSSEISEDQAHKLETHRTPRDRMMTCDISPRDENQHWGKSPMARINTMWQAYSELYAKIFQYCDYYELCQEVSPNGRIHYHCNLIPTNGQEYYVRMKVGEIQQHLKDQTHYDLIELDHINFRHLYLQKDKGIDGWRYITADSRHQ